MLGGRSGVAGAGQGQAEAELRVVVGRAGLDDPPEVVGGRGVPPASNCARASASRTLRDCGSAAAARSSSWPRPRRAAPVQQLQAAVRT